jgi:hypothetical protein
MLKNKEKLIGIFILILSLAVKVGSFVALYSAYAYKYNTSHKAIISRILAMVFVR